MYRLLNITIKATFITLLSFVPIETNATTCDTFTITSEMIKSHESCPVPPTSQLKCTAYRQTTNYTCGPAAVMTILRYFGINTPGGINKSAEMRIAKEMGATPGPGGGTTRSQVASWLREHGFNVSTGSNVTTDMLINNIKHHIPTIVSYNNHWIVAKGYNKGCESTYKKQDEIIFADPCCGVSVITREEIDSTWQLAHMQRRQCSINGDYIVATP